MSGIIWVLWHYLRNIARYDPKGRRTRSARWTAALVHMDILIWNSVKYPFQQVVEETQYTASE